jgi:hypothetical protein
MTPVRGQITDKPLPKTPMLGSKATMTPKMTQTTP